MVAFSKYGLILVCESDFNKFIIFIWLDALLGEACGPFQRAQECKSGKMRSGMACGWRVPCWQERFCQRDNIQHDAGGDGQSASRSMTCMTIFYICCLIGLLVFGAMLWSIIHHRKSMWRPGRPVS